MKRFKEITLNNLGELESIINTVKAEANDKKDYIQKTVILVGEETIRKAIDKYHVGCLEREWRYAADKLQHLKIDGTAEFVYVAYVGIYRDAKWANRGDVNVYCIEKVVSYHGHMLSAYTDNRNGKTYRFCLFNEDNDNIQCVTVEKPNRVGTLTDKKAAAWLSALLDEAKKRQEARKVAEKNNYYLKITTNGAAVSDDVIPESLRHFYDLTDEQIKFTTLGLVIGLRARYKKPKVEIYKEANGEYKLCGTQQY